MTSFFSKIISVIRMLAKYQFAEKTDYYIGSGGNKFLPDPASLCVDKTSTYMEQLIKFETEEFKSKEDSNKKQKKSKGGNVHSLPSVSDVADVEFVAHKKSKSGGGAPVKGLPPGEITDKDIIKNLKEEIKALKNNVTQISAEKKAEYETKRVIFFFQIIISYFLFNIFNLIHRF